MPAHSLMALLFTQEIVPVKTVTLPRLELLGVLLLSRLIKCLHKIKTSRIMCWTDSYWRG
uniref:Uncharacterized protein n=1 Tax=Strigamia maritima TaxID=126957 RepID=T1IQK1_STRMM